MDFKFSIIMAAYNVEKYLEESIESIINQDIGFEDNIQLIIVDDGSEDDSLNIINNYKNGFPNNIVVLTQEHSGVASARNLGLKYVNGEYINFLDADDYLSIDTLSSVYNYFKSNNDLNIVSIPIIYFEKEDIEDKLNNKSTSLNIINLNKFPDNPLLSISSVFIKFESIEDHFFDTNMIYSQDSLLLNKILLNNECYGFIPSSKYYHRLRDDSTNLSNQILFEKEYYINRLQQLHINLINYCLDKYSKVPKFIQYTILYELLSIIDQPYLDIFDSDDDEKEFFAILKDILSYIGDDVIFNNRFIEEHSLELFLMYLKKGNKNYDIQPFNVVLKFDDYVADNLNRHKFWIDDIYFKEDFLVFEGFFNSLFDINDISIVAVKEKEGKYNFYSAAYNKNKGSFNKQYISKIVEYSHQFILKIPTDDLLDSNFRLRVDYHKDGNKFNNKRENLVFTYLPIDFTFGSGLSHDFKVNSEELSLSLDDKIFNVERGFLFSVVMAVYNTQDYIGEAIDSIINQTIGFEDNIQMVFVNDGSVDESEEIILSYQSKYPENIVLVNQENQGQAAARNNGLNYARGKYINFLDSDDYLSENAMEEVYTFFNENTDVDVVSIPLTVFGRSNENHNLNYKFKESKIIDLSKEPNNPQLHVSSSFVNFRSIKDNKFPTKIRCSEDGNFVNNILLDKEKLGVVSTAEYFYRKRFDESSTLDTMSLKKDFYIPRLKYHFMDLISKSISKYGEVPKFIQYSLIYDLQWLVSVSDLDVFDTKSELNEFWYYFDLILSYIQWDVIAKNVNIKSGLVKKFLLYMKNKRLHYEIKDNEIIFLKTHDYELDKLNAHNVWLDIVEIDNGYLNISGFMNSLFDSNYISIDAMKINGDEPEIFPGKYVEYSIRKGVKFLGVQWQYSYTFDIKVPLLPKDHLSNLNVVVNFHRDGDNSNFKKSNIIPLNLNLKFLPHCRMNDVHNYIVKDDYIIEFNEDNSFNIMLYRYKSLLNCELSVMKKIRESKSSNFSIMLLRWCYLLSYRIMKKRKIYLFMDRIDSADDNAEHLFKYASSIDDDVKKYFVLSGNKKDYRRISKYGKVIKFNSFKHRFLYIFAQKVISSHPDESILDPFFDYDKEKDQRKFLNGLVSSGTYFLQHGVTKDNISVWLKKYDKNLKLILTVSDEESDSFLDEGYNYSKEIIQALGFPRFDNLRDNHKNKILIIPTWRNYIEGNRNVFKSSDYFKSLNQLINDSKLIKLCEDNDFEIIFKGHPKLNTVISEDDDEKYIDLFDINDHIKLSTEESYQQLFAEGALLITDFSSVFFDFAYLKKPVIYYQPNDDYHHEKSYFNYDEMGFGHVIHNHDDLIDVIEKYIQNGCKMEIFFKQRVDSFFKYIDKNNCKRVYDWIRSH